MRLLSFIFAIAFCFSIHTSSASESTLCFSKELIGIKIGDDLEKTLTSLKSKYAEANSILAISGAAQNKGNETFYPIAYSANPITIITLGTVQGSGLSGKISSVQVSGQINGAQSNKPYLYRNLKLGSSITNIKKTLGDPVATKKEGESTYWSFRGLNPDCNIEIVKGKLSSIRIK